MPVYRLTLPGKLVEADSARQEGIHLVLRGMALVIGKPREVVIRRVPAGVIIEVVEPAEVRGRLSGPPLI